MSSSLNLGIFTSTRAFACREGAIGSLKRVSRREGSIRHLSSSASFSSYEVVKNQVGVQLLSSSLHSQLFKNTNVPSPTSDVVQISLEHLAKNGLNTTQASVLPAISFKLPPLRGRTLEDHFANLGAEVAQPYLGLAELFGRLEIPPPPITWNQNSGWTKYYPDGFYETVADLGSESMLCFDVETMPPYHQYPVMATAVSPSAWYSWVSPWLLGESDSPVHLIPFGDPKIARIVVGHNVSYDRARVKEEYNLRRTATRWVDTMSLHVAVTGICSPQRALWISRRKQKQNAETQKMESISTVMDIIHDESSAGSHEDDSINQANHLAAPQTYKDDVLRLKSVSLEDQADQTDKCWEDVTSVNSLAEVARLHCGIEMDKEIRNDFMISTPSNIRADLGDYLSYCSTDVATTHAVYRKTLPAFRESCPSPVSWAGIMAMGSGFLTVNNSWKDYLERAESKYRSLETQIKDHLIDLAHEAKELMRFPDRWQSDDWLSQLDWSPKVPSKSRGVEIPPKASPKVKIRQRPTSLPPQIQESLLPRWYLEFLDDPFTTKNLQTICPLLLRISRRGKPIYYSTTDGWMQQMSKVPANTHLVEPPNGSVDLSLIPITSGRKVHTLLGRQLGLRELQSAELHCPNKYQDSLALEICNGTRTPKIRQALIDLATSIFETGRDLNDPWTVQLDWREIAISTPERFIDHLSVTVTDPPSVGSEISTNGASAPIVWPKWYWELAAPKKGKPPGAIDLTVRNRVAPLLLRLRWLEYPLFHSRQHGWTFRIPVGQSQKSLGQSPLTFSHEHDTLLQYQTSLGFTFFKVPHKDGEKANVGSPLSKTFMVHAEQGTLTSPGDKAKMALDMNAQCSYWISARDRIMNQLVIWRDDHGVDMGLPDAAQEWGMILPQVITMGTVTRRAIERTWLTASNAKANRVGSELKAMIRAPPGYSIVGADVDSEELWISSLMGDAQFGIHGATALGWMTLEGQRKFGTDLHSKTAQILSIGRDQAKVFNYSRIYGAGMRHAALLLRQSNPGMSTEAAKNLAKSLYQATKGSKVYRKDIFNRKFWHGGSESYVFNKLEEIALSERPETPALGCTITQALRKEYLPESFGTDFMPSRINWVVQSSGVDYLHLLIVAMEYLVQRYAIDARYLISVHDELRYLVKEEDRYRCALALQVANLWTRSLFAYKLGMDNLPQGVAFFSAIDIDHVLRKEVDLPCVTPSQPVPIAPGEKLDIAELLAKTKGVLSSDIEYATGPLVTDIAPPASDYLKHRAESAYFLKAQATSEVEDIHMLAARDKSHTKRRAAPQATRASTLRASPTTEWDDVAQAEALRISAAA